MAAVHAWTFPLNLTHCLAVVTIDQRPALGGGHRAFRRLSSYIFSDFGRLVFPNAIL